MTEQAFTSIWGLSYSDYGFLHRFGTKSQVMVACQLLYFRQHARFLTDRSDLDPDVIAYVADQLGVTDELSYSFSGDTARRQRTGILDFLEFRRASDRDRANLQAWMIEQLGGQDLNLRRASRPSPAKNWLSRVRVCETGIRLYFLMH
jgi:hypothetical protein